MATLRKSTRIAAFSVGGLILVILTAAAGGFAWLQTDGGRTWLARTVEAAAAGPDLSVRVDSIEGAVPFAMRVTGLRVADRQGDWLSLADAAFTLAPADLLRGRLVLSLSVERLAVARAPIAPAEAAPEPPAAETAPSWPTLPFAIELKQLAVSDLTLGAALLDASAPARLRIAAGALADQTGVTLTLDAHRIDGVGGSVGGRFAYRADEGALTADVTAEEPAGGVLAALMALPGRPPVSVRLKGGGTLADGAGRLEASAGPLGRVEAGLTAAASGQGYQITLDGGGSLTASTGPWQALIGSSPRLGFAGVVDPTAGVVRIERARLDLATAGVSVAGRYAWVDDRADLTITADTKAVTLPLGPQSPTWTAAKLDLTLTGSVAAPTIKVRLDAEGPRAAGYGAEQLRLTAEAAPTAGTGATPLAGTFDLAVKRPTAPDPALAKLAGPQVTLAGSVAADPALTTIELSRLRLETAAATVSGHGRAEPGQGTGRFDAVLEVADLARLQPVVPNLAGGRVRLEAALTAAAEGRLQAKLTGAIRDLRTGDPKTDALTKGEITLAGTVGQEGESLVVKTLEVRGPGLVLEADGRYAPNRVEGRGTLAVAHLQSLAAPFALPVAGALDLTAVVEGRPDAPAVKARISGRDLVWQGRELGSLTADVENLGTVAAPRARIRLDGTVLGAPLAGGTELAMTDQLITLKELLLASGPNKIAGTVHVRPDGSAAEGNVTVELPKPGELAKLVGVDVAGRLRLTLGLSPPGPGSATQTVRIEGVADDVAIGTTVQQAKLDLTARAPRLDGLGGPAAAYAGSFDVKGIVAGTTRIATATGRIGGDPGAISIRLDATGTAETQPIRMTAAITARPGDTAHKIVLEQAVLGYGTQDFRLTAPATLELAGSRTALSPLRLTAGTGKIAVQGSQEGDRVTAALDIADLPLDLARLFDPTLGLSGRVAATARLSGTLPAPDLTLTARADGVKAAALTQAVPGGIDARLSLTWRNRSLTADGTVSTDGERGGTLKVTGSMPLALDPVTFAPNLGDSTPIRGRATGRYQLARLNDLLATTGDRVQGTVAVDLGVNGTLAKPDLAGTVTVDGGSYENQASGARITDIGATLRGTGERLVVERFGGRTPNGGSIGARGEIRLAPATARTIDIQFDAREARLVENELATVDVYATLVAAGAFTAPRVTGTVRVSRAEVRVPDSMPPSIVPLEVVEVGAPPTTGRPSSAAAPRSKPAPGRPAAGSPPPGSPPPSRPGTANRAAGRPSPAEPPSAAAAPVAIGLDIAASAERVFVRGRGLEAEFGGKLAITGTASDPRITGDLNLKQGRFDLLGKVVRFNRGTIRFRGLANPNPDLDLVAATPGANFTALVKITGTVKDPELKLEAEGANLPPDEVLSQALFGKGRTQLSALEAATLAQSAAQLIGFGGGGGGVMAKLRSALGFDRLEFSGEKGGQISAGRYLTEDVYVGVEQGVTGTTGSRAKVEVDITDNIQAEAGIGTQGDPSIGLKFEWDY